MESLFFELIRVAIGKQDSLSRTPSAKEWKHLFKIAERQRLLGICFYGVKKVASPKYNNDDDYDYDRNATTIPGDLYDYWLGTAALIQQQNQKVNRQCVEVCNKLQDAGFKCSILKGQGIAQLYNEGRRTKDERQDESNFLGMFRQSGDIDVWVDGGMKKAMAWAKKEYGYVEFDYINAHLPMYKDTEVELHWRVSMMTSLFKNKKLQQWLEEHKNELLKTTVILPNRVGNIPVPSLAFNSFYILLHCYNHMFSEGVGLRQVMDYFFVLQEYEKSEEYRVKSEELVDLLRQFGMLKFAKAMMWVLKHVFEENNVDEERRTKNEDTKDNWRERYPWMIVEPDEKEGRFLLKELMLNGNFGHYDKRIKKISKNKKIQAVMSRTQHNLHVATHYPSEFFWPPIWLAYHFFWKRTVGR